MAGLRPRKRACSGQKTNPIDPVPQETPENRMRFVTFQALPDHETGVPSVIALGVDGRLYLYDWEGATWQQAPDTYIPDNEIEVGHGCF